jgi:glutaredoxin
MDENNVPYEYTDVDLLEGAERESVIAEVRRLNPQCSFPTIMIGNQVIVGFRENQIREALGI